MVNKWVNMKNIFLICKCSCKILSRTKVIILSYGIYNLKNGKDEIDYIVISLLKCMLVMQYFKIDYDKPIIYILKLKQSLKIKQGVSFKKSIKEVKQDNNNEISSIKPKENKKTKKYVYGTN